MKRHTLVAALLSSLLPHTAFANPIVVDLLPGSLGGQAMDLKSDGTRAFFWSSDKAKGDALLWATDGTPSGTALRKRFVMPPNNKFAVGLRVYATTPQGVYFEGPIVAGDYGPFSFMDNAGNVTALGTLKSGYTGDASRTLPNGKTIFAPRSGLVNGPLISSDGTAAGTVALGSDRPENVLEMSGAYVYFSSAIGKLGRTDGSAITTISYPGKGYVREIVPCGGKIFFASETLHVTDGTSMATNLNAPASRLACVGGKLLFFGYDKAAGNELWSSDGTVAGTALLKDIRPGATGSVNIGIATASSGTHLYFYADDGVHGKDPYVSDGTSAGTKMLVDRGTDSTAAYYGPDPSGKMLGVIAEASSPTAYYLISGSNAVDIMPAFNGLSAPITPNQTVLLGSKLLYESGTYATGAELAIFDFSAPLVLDAGTPPVADAGAPTSSAASDAGTKGTSNAADASKGGSDGGAGTDPAGAIVPGGSNGATDEPTDEAGCSASGAAPTSAWGMSPFIALAIVAYRRRRVGRSAESIRALE